MNSAPIRIFKVIASTSVIATATGFAALSIAAAASADNSAVYDQLVGVGGCPGAPPNPCGKPLNLPFTTTAGNAVEVTFTKNPNQECPDFNVIGDFDGVTHFTVGEVVPLAHGNHTINLDASCDADSLSSWGGHLVINQISQTGKPAGGQQGAPQRTVTSNVDLYDVPGGGGAVIGHLIAGDAVQVIGQCPMNNLNNPDDANNGWCDVTDTTQNVSGFAWGDAVSH
jgi:hypothetical protein